MGTQLFMRGLSSGHCGMLWNVERPDEVAAIHRAYVDAGCNLITSNSFGGTRYALDLHGLGQRVGELNRAAAAVARAAAGDDAWVLGDVGPCGDFLEPVGDLTADELREAFQAQIGGLLDGGADAILVETMSDPAEAAVAIEAARACNPEVPVIVSYAFQKTGPGEFRTMMGSSVAAAVESVIAAGAAIVGANCGTTLSLDDYVILARQLLVAAGDTPVMVQPNAGSPRSDEHGSALYDATPEQMAETARQLRAAGVRIVGGCCGTSPAHLAAISRALG